MRTVLKSKIHRARVTQADLHYEGSITIDRNLMDAADLVPFERVQIVNVNNGARIETYLIPGPRGSREIQVNGAAARLFYRGDRIIVCAFALLDEAEIRSHHPKVVILDAANHVATA